MTPDAVKNFYKTKYNFHKQTGLAASTLGNWLRWGYIPEGAQCKLEHITKGLLKAELKHDNFT